MITPPFVWTTVPAELCSRYVRGIEFYISVLLQCLTNALIDNAASLQRRPLTDLFALDGVLGEERDTGAATLRD